MQVVRVKSRMTASPQISMWGTLYKDQLTGELLGWVADTWNERGVVPPLNPKLYWIPRKEDKFYRVLMNIDPGFRTTFEVLDEDKAIEPQRAAFIRVTLKTWEQEYADEITGGK